MLLSAKGDIGHNPLLMGALRNRVPGHHSSLKWHRAGRRAVESNWRLSAAQCSHVGPPQLAVEGMTGGTVLLQHCYTM